MQPPVVRARTVGELLDAAFQVLRAHYVPLVLVSAVFLVPPLILASLIRLPIVGMFGSLMSMAAMAATALVVSDIYLGKPVRIGRGIGVVGRRIVPVCLAAILQIILLGIGFVCLLLPAVLVFVWSFAMPAALILEELRPWDAWRRSDTLTEGHFWHVLATVGLAWIIFFAAWLGMELVLGLTAEMAGIGVHSAVWISDLLALLLRPFPGVVSTLLYYDLRIRKEGFDLQLLAEAMEVAPAAPPALA